MRLLAQRGLVVGDAEQSVEEFLQGFHGAVLT